MNRRTSAVTFAFSLIALIAITVGFFLAIQPSEAGDVAAVEASLSEPPTLPGSAPDGLTGGSRWASSGGDAFRAPSVPVWSGTLADSPALAMADPVALRLSSIDVDAPIIPTGVDSRTGQMEVPGNVRDVAWYEFGARPGESGSAVLAAHVDLAGRGPGVFFHLRDVEPGDLVEVEFGDGSVSFFRVEARTVYPKDELPLDTIFAEQGSPVLTLITCGGGFSESAGSYDSNVVVYAVPVPDRDLSSAR